MDETAVGTALATQKKWKGLVTGALHLPEADEGTPPIEIRVEYSDLDKFHELAKMRAGHLSIRSMWKHTDSGLSVLERPEFQYQLTGVVITVVGPTVERSVGEVIQLEREEHARTEDR